MEDREDAAFGVDLSYVHDAGFGVVGEAAAGYLVDMLGKQGTRTGKVVELGCGSGSATAKLIEGGFDVTAFDISPAMIDLAKERLPGADLRVGSFVDVELPRATAMIAAGEVLNYQFDSRSVPAGLPGLFARIYEALEPGGVFLFDVSGPGRVGPEPQRTWSSGEDWGVMLDLAEVKNTLTREIVSFRRFDGSGYRRSTETHILNLYGPQAVLASLAGAGFRATQQRAYGKTPLAVGHRSYLARRPE